MTTLTDAQLAEWRALCVGPDGAALNVRLIVERGSMLALLDEVIAARAARQVRAMSLHEMLSGHLAAGAAP